MNLEYRLNENYDRLTANDREVICRILRDKGRAVRMNSTELANYCHISRTTLVRLFKKLGIPSFTQFRLLLEERSGRQDLDRLELPEIISGYHRMIDDLKDYDYREVCQAIREAGTVYLFGTGNEQKVIGEEFKRIFLMFGKCCIDLFDYGEVEYASASFKETDLFVAISLSGESQNGIDVLRLVQCREIRTLSITRWTNNTMARMCRYNLYAGTRMIGGGEKAGAGKAQNDGLGKVGAGKIQSDGSGAAGASRIQSDGSGQGSLGYEENGYEMVAAFYILLDILSVNYLEYVRDGHEVGGAV